MDFGFSPEENEFRREVAEFLDKESPQEWREKKVTIFDATCIENWELTYREMAEKLGAKGWLSLHWPKEYGGQELSPFYPLILIEELFKRHSPGYDPFALGIVAPALLQKGSEEQKRKHLPGIASGRVMWCETLSEPGHGSDLAAIEVFAREEDDYFVVNGQKIWTTNAHIADWNALVARTDREASPNYRGISFFLVDMKTPGITVNPIINIAGHHDFNEVFFDEVKIPKENLVGEKNKGFYIVMSLLDYERTCDPVYAMVATYIEELVEYARENNILDTLWKHRLAQLSADCEVARLLHYRVVWMQTKGMAPNVESAVSKLYNFELNQRASEAGMELLGHYGLLMEGSPRVPMYGRIPSCYLCSIGSSLMQGTSEIDRDVIAYRGLELPRMR